MAGKSALRRSIERNWGAAVISGSVLSAAAMVSNTAVDVVDTLADMQREEIAAREANTARQEKHLADFKKAMQINSSILNDQMRHHTGGVQKSIDALSDTIIAQNPFVSGCVYTSNMEVYASARGQTVQLMADESGSRSTLYVSFADKGGAWTLFSKFDDDKGACILREGASHEHALFPQILR